ncbi:MAG: hypothetical protein KAU95_01700 [Candidatus Aenigmarchaeota archaeon]|nr:hypothetical protein [Candidatus Aenigmarchaeota archaeon]
MSRGKPSFETGSCGDGFCVMGEDYENCPGDCASGSIDGYCDGVSDGICDQDCIMQEMPEKDIDCLYTFSVCGDKICDAEKGENYNTCPADCPKPSVCGNIICEKDETQENCCVDCGCPSGERCLNDKCAKIEICGDKVCGTNENYKTCPADCSSGGDDDYCDKAEDGVCDPNCERSADYDCLCNQDETCEPEYEDYLNCPMDCEKPISPFLIIIIPIFIIIGILVYFIYAKSKKNYEGDY